MGLKLDYCECIDVPKNHYHAIGKLVGYPLFFCVCDKCNNNLKAIGLVELSSYEEATKIYRQQIIRQALEF